MPPALDNLPDDVLISLFALVEIPDILLLRQVCKRMHQISSLRIVWTTACTRQILARNYPFAANVSLGDLSLPELEGRTLLAYRLALRWLSSAPLRPSVLCDFDATNGTPVSDLRFVPGSGRNWLLAVSKGIWSVLSLWEFDPGLDGSKPRKLFEWSRKGALVKNLVLSDEASSTETLLAVSVIQAGATHVEILDIRPDYGFSSLQRINTTLSPMHLRGDLLVLCDTIDLSLLVNWKTGASSILQRPPKTVQTSTASINDHCIQVVIHVGCIFVVRARSLTLFLNPALSDPPVVHRPIETHSFGWVDGVAVVPLSSSCLYPIADNPPSLAILVRPEPDDPWAPPHAHALDFYVLHAGLDSTPETRAGSHDVYAYMFPPTHSVRIPSTHGPLQCSALRLGRSGTAVWIEPRDHSAAGLLQDLDGSPFVRRQEERLVGAVFRAGGMTPPDHEELGCWDHPEVVQPRTLRVNAPLNDWRALDYEEAAGVIAVGSTRGRILILSLAT